VKTFAQKQVRQPGATLGLDRREHPIRLWPAARTRKPACSECEGEAALDTGPAVRAAERGGAPLPKEVRSHFEPRFGYDFSRVRVHADGEAADGARAVRARAYTMGHDIVFGDREYAPGTTEGKRLLAHELAHVVQQAPAVISRQKADKQGKPQDLKKLLKDPCYGERVDETKARCEFSDRQSAFVRIIKAHALRKCARAIAAIDMPGNERKIKGIAKDYFHLDIKLTEKTRETLKRTIKAVSDKLEKAPIECGTCQDEGCIRGFVAYALGRDTLVVCPPFFMSEIYPVPLTPRFLIHEACHLAGVNRPSRDEMYCH